MKSFAVLSAALALLSAPIALAGTMPSKIYGVNLGGW